MSVIVTPEQMLDDATALNADVDRLSSDILNSQVDLSFQLQWQTFVKDWRAFYSDLQGAGGWLDRLWGGTQEAIDRYRQQVVDWEARYKRIGGDVTGPDVTPPEKLDLFHDLMWIALAVGAALVAVAVIKYKR